MYPDLERSRTTNWQPRRRLELRQEKRVVLVNQLAAFPPVARWPELARVVWCCLAEQEPPLTRPGLKHKGSEQRGKRRVASWLPGL